MKFLAQQYYCCNIFATRVHNNSICALNRLENENALKTGQEMMFGLAVGIGNRASIISLHST